MFQCDCLWCAQEDRGEAQRFTSWRSGQSSEMDSGRVRGKGMIIAPNQPAPRNPAMTLRLTIEARWAGVGDPRRRVCA